MQGVDHYADLRWSGSVGYGAMRRGEEYELSAYGFEVADVEMLRRHFDDHEREAERTLDAGLVWPAYEQVLKMSHTFNLLDARGAVSVTERTEVIGRVRKQAARVAQAWVKQRKEALWPLLPGYEDRVRARDAGEEGVS